MYYGDPNINAKPDLSRQIQVKQGKTTLSHLPFPTEFDKKHPSGDKSYDNFEELMASTEYMKVVNKIRRYTGFTDEIPSNYMGSQAFQTLYSLCVNTMNDIKRIESTHKKELEDLAVYAVINYFGIDTDTVNIVAKLGNPDMIGVNIDKTKTNQDKLEIDKEKEKELVDKLKDFDAKKNEQAYMEYMTDGVDLIWEKAKRRAINSIIQGTAKTGGDDYLFNFCKDELIRITGDENIINKYGIFMSIAELQYWQLGDSTVENMMQNSGAGQERVEIPNNNDDDDDDGGDNGNDDGDDNNAEKYKLYATGIVFPVLLHELIKGIMEVTAAAQFINMDRNIAKDIMQSEDRLVKETWDLLLGPYIATAYRNTFPDEVFEEDGKIMMNYLWTAIFRLVPKQFFVLFKHVLSGTQTGKDLMKALLEGQKRAIQDENYEEAIQEFEEQIEEAQNEDIGEEAENQLKNLLGNLGIDYQGDIDLFS